MKKTKTKKKPKTLAGKDEPIERVTIVIKDDDDKFDISGKICRLKDTTTKDQKKKGEGSFKLECEGKKGIVEITKTEKKKVFSEAKEEERVR